MFQRFAAKFTLAAHVAVLAALPVALTPFLDPARMGRLILWLSAITAAIALLLPSIRAGETLGTARARVLSTLLRDPLTWFFVVAAAFALLVWCNDGVKLFYNAEEGEWIVHPPKIAGMPASVSGFGFLPFCVVLGVAVCVLSVRHSLGAQARVWSGLAAAFIAGIGGLAAMIASAVGCEGFGGAFGAKFSQMPQLGSLFVSWLFVALEIGRAHV